MKITKSQLKQIIKEELEKISLEHLGTKPVLDAARKGKEIANRIKELLGSYIEELSHREDLSAQVISASIDKAIHDLFMTMPGRRYRAHGSEKMAEVLGPDASVEHT